MKKYLIIYHREDNDGLVSGTMFYDYLLNVLKIDKGDIDLLGADYNSLSQFGNDDAIENLKDQYENIIMTDISFNDYKYMKKLYKEFGNNFIWCDHHKPIIDDSHRHKFSGAVGIRDTTKSTILCVYEFLYDPFNDHYNKKEIPELFRILSAWDSWTYEKEGYEFEYVRNVNKAVTVEYKLDFDKILDLVKLVRMSYLEDQNIHTEHGKIGLDMMIDDFYKLGKQLNEYDDQVMENIIKNSGDCSWKVRFYDEDKGRPLYHSACAIFHQGATNSLMFKSLERKGINHGLVFKHQPNGNWVLSMYNVSEHEWTHCGEFLKERYGGGGHKGAAGCTLTESQFIKILKSKTI